MYRHSVSGATDMASPGSRHAIVNVDQDMSGSGDASTSSAKPVLQRAILPVLALAIATALGACVAYPYGYRGGEGYHHGDGGDHGGQHGERGYGERR